MLSDRWSSAVGIVEAFRQRSAWTHRWVRSRHRPVHERSHGHQEGMERAVAKASIVTRRRPSARFADLPYRPEQSEECQHPASVKEAQCDIGVALNGAKRSRRRCMAEVKVQNERNEGSEDACRNPDEGGPRKVGNALRHTSNQPWRQGIWGQALHCHTVLRSFTVHRPRSLYATARRATTPPRNMWRIKTWPLIVREADEVGERAACRLSPRSEG